MIFCRAISALVWKVSTSPLWSGKSQRIRFGLESLNESASVWKVAPHPPQSRRIDSWSHRLGLCLESRAVSALLSKNAPSTPWYRKSRRLQSERESCAASTTFAKVLSLPFWLLWPGWSRHCFLRRAVSRFAPYSSRESPEKLFLSLAVFRLSGNSRPFHLDLFLESLEMAEFDRESRA